jgi:predicted nucleotidyltransferase
MTNGDEAMHTQAQRDVIERVSEMLEARDDVDALWLSGSLGAGEGDEWSDVDFLVLVPQDKIAALPETLKAQMRDAFQTVLSNEIFGRVLNFITPDWARFDLNLVTPPELARFDASVLKLLFNKGENAPPVQPRAEYSPAPTTIEKLSTEFLRVLGLSAVGLGRREYDVMLNGIDLLRRMTIDLMLEENAVSPSKRGGVLKRNPFLTQEQRADLVSVPAAGADGTGIVAALEAIARIFLARAKALCTRTGAAWPDAFERATRAHLKRSGMEI